LPWHLCSHLEKCYRPPRSPALHNGCHFLGDSSPLLITEPGCKSKSMYPADKLGRPPFLFQFSTSSPLSHTSKTTPANSASSRSDVAQFFAAQHQNQKQDTLTPWMLFQVPISSAQGCSWPLSNHLPPAPCPNQATQLFHTTIWRDTLSSPTIPWGQLSPDVFSGYLAILLDGRALIFVVQPSRSLAGPVAVVGELALAAAVEPLLPFEAGVTDEVRQAGGTEGPGGSYLGKGPASFASLGSPRPLRWTA